MTDSDGFRRRAFQRMQQEISELDSSPQAKYQAQLDRWMWEQRAIEEEHRRLLRELNSNGLRIWD